MYNSLLYLKIYITIYTVYAKIIRNCKSVNNLGEEFSLID